MAAPCRPNFHLDTRPSVTLCFPLVSLTISVICFISSFSATCVHSLWATRMLRWLDRATLGKRDCYAGWDPLLRDQL